jgi:hypothetical protein
MLSKHLLLLRERVTNVIFLKADAEAAMENYMGLKKRKWFIPFKEEKEKL